MARRAAFIIEAELATTHMEIADLMAAARSWLKQVGNVKRIRHFLSSQDLVDNEPWHDDLDLE